MKKFVKSILTHEVAKRGFLFNKLTEKKEINNLIESLHPYKTELELIRLGPNGDGGYLVPSDLEGIEACFSPGVDKISEFELDCLKYKMKLFMADKSVEKPNLNIPEDKYHFLKKFIGCTNNDDFITMDEWIKLSGVNQESDLLLQMDIEASEYYSIINMSDSLLKRFRIMVIEFHKLQNLWAPLFFDMAKTVFDKILQTHICIHIHPNNTQGIYLSNGIAIPKLAEFTFIRKDRVGLKNYQNHFPHKLDYDNTTKEHIVLPECWYKAH